MAWRAFDDGHWRARATTTLTPGPGAHRCSYPRPKMEPRPRIVLPGPRPGDRRGLRYTQATPVARPRPREIDAWSRFTSAGDTNTGELRVLAFSRGRPGSPMTVIESTPRHELCRVPRCGHGFHVDRRAPLRNVVSSAQSGPPAPPSTQRAQLPRGQAAKLSLLYSPLRPEPAVPRRELPEPRPRTRPRSLPACSSVFVEAPGRLSIVPLRRGESVGLTASNLPRFVANSHRPPRGVGRRCRKGSAYGVGVDVQDGESRVRDPLAVPRSAPIRPRRGSPG